MPKVSVIIPTYNDKECLCETIDSAFKQTFEDYEIIVVDDGSTDGTKEALIKYNGKIRFFYQENKGVSAARNKGIKEAKGDYIAFLDDDDIWMPDKLRCQVEIMDSDPELAMIFTDGEAFDEKGIVRASLGSSNSSKSLLDNSSFKYKITQANFNDGSQFKGDFYKDLLLGNLVVNSTALVNKKHLQKIGYLDESLVINGDYDLWLKIASKYTVLYLNKVTAKWRIRESSLSGPLNIRAYNYRKSDGELFEKYLKLCPVDLKPLIKKRIHVCYKIAAWGYLHINDQKEARRLYMKSLVYNKKQLKLYLYILVTFLPEFFINLIRKYKTLLCPK